MNEGAIYNEGWPKTAILYAGPKGSLSKVGDVMPVHNFLDGTDKLGIVAKVTGDRYEYTVSIEGGD